MPSRAAPFVLLVLAGCLAPAASPPATAPEGPAAASELAFTACADFTGHLPLPMAEARAAAPAPLEPRRYLDGDLGWRWLIAVRCGTMAGPDGTVAEAPFVLDTVVVDAPEAWTPEDVGFLVVVRSVHAQEEALAAWFRGGGHAAAQTGPVGFEVADGPSRVGRATFDGVTFTVAAATPEGEQGADFVRAFLVADGEVAGAVDWRVAESRVRGGVATASDGGSGRGGHFWSDTYDHVMTRVALPVD